MRALWCNWWVIRWTFLCCSWYFGSSPSRQVFGAGNALISPSDGAENSRYLFVTAASCAPADRQCVRLERVSVDRLIVRLPTQRCEWATRLRKLLLCNCCAITVFFCFFVLFINGCVSAGPVRNYFWFWATFYCLSVFLSLSLSVCQSVSFAIIIIIFFFSISRFLHPKKV